MKRRDFLKQSSAALALATLSRSTTAQAPGSKPMNLLFITADDMNWSMPGFMGGKYNLTPRLDELAKRSHRFVNNRTAAAICQPSREAIMTGLVPHRSGGLGFTPVHEGTPTLASVLHEHGYFTGCIHKLEHMQPESCFPWDYKIPGKDRNPLEYESGVREAISQARTAKKPFFIICNINDPHRPFYGSHGAAGVDHNETGPYRIPRVLQGNDVEAPSFLEDLPPIREEFAQYCNSVQRLDGTIGKVLAVLESSAEANNTMVVFCSDHGMPFPFSKATCYNNGTREPVLLSWPGMGPAKSFEENTCNVDILPTLLDILHVPSPEGIDGRSWMPIVEGHPQSNREYVVTSINTIHSKMAYPMRAIQNMRYSFFISPWSDGKLRFNVESMQGLTYKAMAEAAKTDAGIAARVKQYIYGFPMAFYDLEKDPDQRVNAIHAPEYRKQIAEMKHLLLEEMERTNDPQLGNYKALLAGGKPTVIEQVTTQARRNP